MAVRNERDEDFRDTIPFTMHRVTALSVSTATDEFGAYGINVHGARVLVVLLQNAHIRVGEIAEITRIEVSTLSHMLRRFERDGFIVRKRQPDDNRSVMVALTPRGRRIANKVHELTRDHQRTMLAGLDRREIATLRRLLRRMEANVLAAVDASSIAEESA